MNITNEQKISECALAIGSGKICSNSESIQLMKKFLITNGKTITNTNSKEIVNEMKKTTGCKKEKCIYQSNFSSYIGESKAKKIIKDRFKLPKIISVDTHDNWLEDKDIDNNLAQLATSDKLLKHVKYHMKDFSNYNTILTKVPLSTWYQQGYRKFAVVLNTDVYGGPGIHWVCMYGDFTKPGREDSPFTLEYFDSGAKPILPEYAEYMTTVEKDFEYIGKCLQSVVVVKQPLQREQSECGVFCLWYIHSRANNIPYSFFEYNHKISDKDMKEFRALLFSNDNNNDNNDNNDNDTITSVIGL